jgi:magnesium transporter
MSTDYISFHASWTVDQALREMRRLRPESSWAYYLYILDEQHRLVATVSLRDVVVSELKTRLEEIMNKDVIYVYDEDKIDAMTEIISKYNLLCVPVVNKDERLLGVVVIEDVVYDLLKSRRRRG